MDKKKLEYFRKRLQSKQEELARLVLKNERDGREADGEPTHDSADKAANSYTKEFLFKQSDENRRILVLINEAYKRMNEGTFGLCVECEEAVQQKRLEAVPWARHCLGCQEKQDRGEI